MDMWVVYFDPTDYPNQWVARKWVVSGGMPHYTEEVVFGDTLQDVREQLPFGIFRLPSRVSDDPVIVEVWI